MGEQRKTTRRQFLLGPAAAGQADELAVPAAEGDGASEAARADQRHYLMYVTRRAMACDFSVFFGAGQHPRAAELAVEALDLVEQLEAQLTVFRPDSELSQLNARAADGPVQVETRLFQLLADAVRLYRETDGAFDITAGPLTKVWGFFRRSGRVPTDAELGEARRRVGSHLIQLDPQRHTVRFLKPGVEINLGAIGKGYALDRCVEQLLADGLEHFLIHGGRSSVVAHGDCPDGQTPQGGWTVGLKHPLRPDRRLAEIRLRHRALGTSGSATQSFRHKGRRLGHILDPRTGRPASGVLSATVLAPDAATADALSTAFYVMGVERALDWCAQHSGIAALLVTEGPTSGSVQLHTAGLGDDDWQCLVD